MLFGSKIKEEYGVESITPDAMRKMIERCAAIYGGHPDWVSEEDHIRTINFAKAVCSETARLTTLAVGIHIDGSARAEWLQAQIDKIYFRLRDWVEYGCAYGTVILKPNGDGVDLYSPEQFLITDQRGGEITGVVFINRQHDQAGDRYFTRLEYHRFLAGGETGGLYAVTNKCYESKGENGVTKPCEIKDTPWAGLMEDVVIENVDKPLFGVLRMPHANSIDVDSPLGMPLIADALEEMRDLDIAYSRTMQEIEDSRRTVLLDSDRLLPTGGKVASTAPAFEKERERLKLPDYVKNVYGDGADTFYQEINPTIMTDARLVGINALLSQIGYKIGFSNGYFVFNQSSGIQTATGVEAEQQRTIQYIKDMRDKLESCLDGLIYALDKFADLYGYAPVGVYEVVYDFGDITYDLETDRARWYSYVIAGKIPFWYYLTKFEGFAEEDAKAIEAQAAPKEPTLFGEEE